MLVIAWARFHQRRVGGEFIKCRKCFRAHAHVVSGPLAGSDSVAADNEVVAASNAATTSPGRE